MKSTYKLLLAMLMLCTISCNERKKVYPDSDLSFFNLKGHVKKFAEINVANIGISSPAKFETFANDDVNYHEHYFSKDGELEKIENINPSPYALNGFKISFYRGKDSLTIIQDSPKEKYIRTYRKTGDTLSLSVYNKIVDNDMYHYNSEKYKKYVSVKDGEFYLMNAYLEGTDRNQIFDQQNYSVVKNKNGYDSLIYMRLESKKDSMLIYSVNYPEYDKKGNWITRQFISNKPLLHFISYTLYRRIEYYE